LFKFINRLKIFEKESPMGVFGVGCGYFVRLSACIHVVIFLSFDVILGSEENRAEVSTAVVIFFNKYKNMSSLAINSRGFQGGFVNPVSFDQVDLIEFGLCVVNASVRRSLCLVPLSPSESDCCMCLPGIHNSLLPPRHAR